MIVLAFALSLGVTDPLSRIDFETGRIESWSREYSDRTSTPPHLGGMGGQPLLLPDREPSPRPRGSTFSMLFRARDFFDLAQHPARAVAKLYRLTETGERAGTACTAQFVGPRHLLTAAHCIFDRETGRPHSGFEIALRYDGGRDEGVIPVLAAWAPTKATQPRPTSVLTVEAYDVGAGCWDIALIEIAEPRGDALGWLGMTSDIEAGGLMHRFSYPNRSAAEGLEAQVSDPSYPEDVRAFIREELEQLRLSEPDFSPANLYYEYGVPDRVQDEALIVSNRVVLPGRSGSALIDDEGRIAAIMSRAAGGEAANCRLTPELIGDFAAIAGVDD